MPLANVDSDNHVLFYEDSGAPPQVTDYTTLIIVHGTTYHGAVFRRILPFASKNKIRVVLVNRRGYPGSSPYTDADLQKIRTSCPTASDGNSAGPHAFFRDRALEFASFMKWLVEHENVPPTTADGQRGGITLMAWSSGVAYAIPVLAFGNDIPEETRRKVGPYFRKFVVFDASPWALGPPLRASRFDPLRDQSFALTPELRAEAFNTWVSGYYTHTSLTSRNTADLEMYIPDASPTSTTTRMSSSELATITDFAAARGGDEAVQGIERAILERMAQRAFFYDDSDGGGEGEPGRVMCWKGVSVDVIWCEKSVWEMIEAVWWLQSMRKEAEEGCLSGRDLRFHMMPRANHFPHWDEPERTMAFFADAVGV